MVKPVRTWAEICLEFENQRKANAVRRALLPECSKSDSDRSSVSVRVGKRVLCLRVEAKDTAALRAAVNTFVRLIKVAKEAIEGCEGWKSSRLSSGTSSRSTSNSSSKHKRS